MGYFTQTGCIRLENWPEKTWNRSVRLQEKYYDKKHRDVGYKVGDLVLLSTSKFKS